MYISGVSENETESVVGLTENEWSGHRVAIETLYLSKVHNSRGFMRVIFGFISPVL